MQNILNLYNYKVTFNRVGDKNVRIIFSNSVISPHIVSDYGKDMDVMSLCLALNKEFNISKIDQFDDPSEDLYDMYIIVDKDLGYKILKTFLDNTLNLENVKRIDDVYLAIYKACYGDTHFSDYVKEYEKLLSNYHEAMKKKVGLNTLNLFTKDIKWSKNDENQIIITITTPYYECPINVEESCNKFDMVELCVKLSTCFGIYHGDVIIPHYDDSWPEKSIVGLQIIIEDYRIAHRLLDYVLSNTDINLLNDEDLIVDKSYAETFKTQIYDRFKKDLEKYENEILHPSK